MKSFFLIPLLIFLNGCSFYTNQIGFDKSRQAVYPLDGGKLKYLSVQSEYCIITLNVTDYSKAKDTIYLNVYNEAYEYSFMCSGENSGPQSQTIISENLLPNKNYKIKNGSQGHRPTETIIITKDNNGIIHLTNK